MSRNARSFLSKMAAFLALAVLSTLPAAAYAGANDIRFLAQLSDNDQSTPTYSDGSGVAEFILERETLKLSWTITYKALSSEPIEVGLYGPELVGATSGLAIDLAKNGKQSPIKGSVVLNDGQLQNLLTGRFYVNILSKKWKAGELRGEPKRQPAAK